MLRRTELEVLATVERGDTISELAMKLDHSESYLSRAAGELVEKGHVRRIDIFNRQVANRLVLADGMEERGEPFSTPVRRERKFDIVSLFYILV